MKFYLLGGRIRDIDELKEGELYSVCGVVGELYLVPATDPSFVYKFVCPSEEISLSIKRLPLIDRIHFGMVYKVKKEFKPREKTLAKLYASIKK